MVEAAGVARVIGTRAFQGLTTAAWVASGELPAGKRRAVRAGVTVAATVVGWATIPKKERPFTWTRQNGFAAVERPESEDAEKPDVPPLTARDVAVTVGLVAAGIGVSVGGRKLEKRWLAGLQRAGHPHPYRALAWRMGLVSAVGTAPLKLLEKSVRLAEKKADR
jgi:hypothetical protein